MDKRALHRISSKFSVEMTAHLIINKISYPVTLIDYNSTGMALELSNDLLGLFASTQGNTLINEIQVRYGSEIIANFYYPKIIRYSLDTKKLVVSLCEQTKKIADREDSTRYSMPSFHQGILTGIDPITINQALFFKVNQISKSGLRALSSKSNRHIMPGSKFSNFDFILPGVGIGKIDFQVVRTTTNQSNLELGIRITSMEKDFEESLTVFLHTHCEPIETKNLKGVEVGSNLKIRRLVTDKDYQDVIGLRTEAFIAAGKLAEGNASDMADEFDQHSIIYCAFLGVRMVGTLRLVFSDNDSKFPFEKYLEFDHKQFKERKLCGEISRLAIAPQFQGTDIFLQLFTQIIIEVGAKGLRYPLSLTTNKLLPYYQGIGALIVSEPFPHPVLESEALTLVMFDPERIIDGKMNSLGWFKVARPALHFLRKYHFIRKPSLGIIHYLRFPFSAIAFLVKKAIGKKTAKPKDQFENRKSAA